jgi:membrane protease YdiL (CAAX protease family)
MPLLLGLTLITCLSFLSLFHFHQAGPISFWSWMSGQLLFLNGLVFLSDPKKFQLWLEDFRRRLSLKIIIGVSASLFLYGIFYFGLFFLGLLRSDSLGQIQGVYGYKEGMTSWQLGLLLSIIIGPGEEILWRWFLQAEWSKLVGKFPGFLMVTGFYTLVHFPTKNYALILAAFVCGLFWGFLFFRFKSVVVNMVSHSLWDLVIFILLPLS